MPPLRLMTLPPFAGISEAVTMSIISAHAELLRILVGMALVVAAFYGIAVFVNRVFVPAERIRELLRCTIKDAKEVNQYLEEIGVTWMKFYGWVCACEGRLMPVMFMDDGAGDRFIATWQESRRAILKLSLERKLDPKWSKMDAVGAATLEIIKERQARGHGIYMPTVEFGED